MMKRMTWAGAAVAAALGLAGCNTPQDYNAGRGAVIGGTTGALIGGLATGKVGGALAGGAIGAAGGAILGAASTPPAGRLPPPPPPPPGVVAGPPGAPPCARWGYDMDGYPVCLRLARY